MFRKPFRVKSQTSMKGSDRKKLRAEIQKCFPELDSEACQKIIPNKEEVITTKIYTHTGDNAFIYSVNKLPVLFELDKQKILYPSVYLLWQYPDLVPRFTTWPPVFQKLVQGADLMLPGVILREPLSPSTFKHITKSQVCSVNVVGNRCPVAVGQTLMSGSDFFDSGMKGKGIHPEHLLGDELWAFGDKSYPPNIEDDPVPEETESDNLVEGVENTDVYVKCDTSPEGEQQLGSEHTGKEAGHTTDNKLTEDFVAQKQTESKRLVDAVEDVEDDLGHKANGNGELEDEMTGATESGACGDNQDLSEGRKNVRVVDSLNIDGCSIQDKVEDEEQKSKLTPEEMDELLQFCFLCAIKSSLKKSDLPISTGTFYKVHVLKYCDKDKNLDVKKSSYKKLSKFLQKQQETGIVKVKELSKGVDSIVEIDKSHQLLRGLEVPQIELAEQEEQLEYQYTPPQITEMFAVSASTLPLFKTFGYSKGSTLKAGDIRTIVTDYVKTNNLQKDESRSDVVLDPVLAEMLLTKVKGDRETLQWEEVFSRLLNKMSPVYEVMFPGQQPFIRKGNVEPIKIDVVQRASNKKATTVENLDLFGIEAKWFAQTVQVKLACSASVTPSQQKNKGPQVVMQGNQTNFVLDLLTGTLKIPKKYISATEKALKSKRR